MIHEVYIFTNLIAFTVCYLVFLSCHTRHFESWQLARPKKLNHHLMGPAREAIKALERERGFTFGTEGLERILNGTKGSIARGIVLPRGKKAVVKGAGFKECSSPCRRFVDILQ